MREKSNMDISKIIIYVIAFNVFLVGLKAGLDKIKDLTASAWDNKLSDVIGIVVTWTNKIIDVVGFNTKHK
jgi:hypothetical protein